MKNLLLVLLTLPIILHAQTRVLDLDGAGSHVELPPRIFSHLDNATIEAWVKWRGQTFPQRFVSFGSFLNDMGLGQAAPGRLHFYVSSRGIDNSIYTDGAIRPGEWPMSPLSPDAQECSFT